MVLCALKQVIEEPNRGAGLPSAEAAGAGDLVETGNPYQSPRGV